MLGLLGLFALGAVLRTALLAPLGAGRVEGAAHHVIADTGEVLDAAAADQDDGVFLEVVPDPGDVGGDLLAGGEAHARDLPQRRVRLLGGGRIDTHADATPLR